jgi:capsular exopolysaccharide synthesis family protein
MNDEQPGYPPQYSKEPYKSDASADGAAFNIDFRAIYYMLREKAWLIALCTVIVALLGGAYIMRTPKVYAAETVVQVEQAQHKVVNIQDINTEDLNSLELMKTIEQNLGNKVLIQRLLSELKLTPEKIGLKPNQKTYSENDLIEALQKRISVKLQRGTRLISIIAENEIPELARDLSLGLVHQYIMVNLEQHSSVTTEANRFLVDKAKQLQDKLEKSEQALQAYKEQNQAVSLEETQNITVAKLKELNSRVTDAKAERLKLEADLAQIQKVGFDKPSELLAITSVADSKVVLDQKKSLAEAEGELANLSQRYKPLHPKFIQAEGKLKELKEGLDSAIIQAAQSIGTAYQAAKETEAKFESALKDQEQTALALNKIAIPFNVLAREVESDRALYESVLTRLKETDVTKGIEQDNIRIVDPALVPEIPIKPRIKLILAGCLLGGACLGIALCFGLESLDSSLKTVDQAETMLGLPALAAVPKNEKVIGHEEKLLILKEPHGAVAEAFRTLRTSLSLLGNSADRRIFLFVSAVPGEGKSFCSINYSVSLAQQGLRTLLVDADLRLPTVGKAFFKNTPHSGVVDVIAGQTVLSDAVRSTDVENLTVLTAGNRAPNPAELLSGEGFGQLLKQALLHYDRVVIDSAPVNAVSDTLLLVKYAQSVCLVVHSGKTPRKAVMRACSKLTEAGARPSGFVLNRMPPHSGAGYYYSYSTGQYGKGVYGAPAA